MPVNRNGRVKSWLQPSTGDAPSSCIFIPENASQSLQEWAADPRGQPEVPEPCPSPLPIPGLSAAIPPLGSEEACAPPQALSILLHLCTQRPASLQAAPWTNRVAAIFSRSHCHCLGSHQGNIFLMFFPNLNCVEKRKTLSPSSVLKLMCQVLNWQARAAFCPKHFV